MGKIFKICLFYTNFIVDRLVDVMMLLFKPLDLVQQWLNRGVDAIQRRKLPILTWDKEYLTLTWRNIFNRKIKRQRLIAWKDIEKIRVFKQDLGIYDQVCALIQIGGIHSGIVEITEEMPGWKEWILSLPEYLPQAQKFEEWFMQVAFPAFAQNHLIIYERPLNKKPPH